MPLAAQCPTPYAASALRAQPQPAPVHSGHTLAAASRSQRLAALGQCLMQHLETPLMVADAQGAVLEANAAARARLERCQGLWQDAAGRLAVRQGGRWVPILKWQSELAAGRSVTLDLEAEGAPMQIVLKPMHGGASGAGTAWVLVTVERAVTTRDQALRRRFRFTPTQARLAEMLCQGMRPAHAAAALGVKISTVRTHVGEMYEKTGTHSQAQLVALLHGG